MNTKPNFNTEEEERGKTKHILGNDVNTIPGGWREGIQYNYMGQCRMSLMGTVLVQTVTISVINFS